jgi:poly(3-hydroxybutyrate) depolymerase
MKVMTAGLCSFLLLVVATGAQAHDAADRDGLEEKSLAVDGQTRTYLCHVPRSRDLNAETPLLLVFHGGERGGREMSRLTGFNRLADAQRFIVVYPAGMNHHWERHAKSLDCG